MENAERERLKAANRREKPWKKWGPYLSERQWGTVREDYSEDGEPWHYFPHDHARSKTYRWGEDGIAGISDDLMNLCFAVAVWNGQDPVLKERLFGLSGPEGNHGEDVKELYYYLDNTPTHSYMKYLYKYPQRKYPYAELIHANASRSKKEKEYELMDTGIFSENRYFDVFTEYAKADAEDMLIRITIHNRGPEAAPLSLLPTLWFRNRWSFGLAAEKPALALQQQNTEFCRVQATHPEPGICNLYYQSPDKHLFTENETNNQRIHDIPNDSPFVKDAFHTAVIGNQFDFLEGKTRGTKFSPLYQFVIESGETREVRLRLTQKNYADNPLDKGFSQLFTQRIQEADAFYASFKGSRGDADLKNIQRQAFAGMLWNKQYYNIDMELWLDGDEGQPPPPEARKYGRNHEWRTLNNEDILSMPDKWEYPWYAAWDTAFHLIPLAMVDPEFAKNQLILFLREWYMAPNGQIPAYEWNFSDVNPPVHAWAALKVYRLEQQYYKRKDISFLKRVFQKLMLNFTWWVNRKDSHGKNVFEGGFLGLDNIGIFDRSSALPGGGRLEQADGTSWMGMYCLNMMEMALEICTEDRDFEDVATKFFEHFVYIAESLNTMGPGRTSLWDEEGGFFYDMLQLPNERYIPLKVRSLVGLTPLFAVTSISRHLLQQVPDFMKRLQWFREYRKNLQKYLAIEELQADDDILFSLVHKERLRRLLQALLDENEFLAPGGIRSLSKVHEQHYSITIEGEEYGLEYQPGESDSNLFGGNSNWRGPVWMPMNYLLIESLRKFYKYYRGALQVEYPTGSGKYMNLNEVADHLSFRLVGMFRKDKAGNRPVNSGKPLFQDPRFRDFILFYEYFHGENCRGMGASHQTGWTGLVAELMECKAGRS